MIYEVDPAVSFARVTLRKELGGAVVEAPLSGVIGMQFDWVEGEGIAEGRYTAVSLEMPSLSVPALWGGAVDTFETGRIEIGLPLEGGLQGTLAWASGTYHLGGHLEVALPGLAEYGVERVTLRTNVSGLLGADGIVREVGLSVVAAGPLTGVIAMASRGGQPSTPAPAPAAAPPPCSVSITGDRIVPLAGTARYTATGTPAGGTYAWTITRGGEYATITGPANQPAVTVSGTKKSPTLVIILKVTYTCPTPPGGTAEDVMGLSVHP